ncbi:MAG: helix-turn-helix domain-containing protein [Clostridiales Family XIII bacterium]|jgi:AraC-like DNA-binding protein|nr:helix-turn-helix domain-containing protein [Clostridiales Family XIII bacterium]
MHEYMSVHETSQRWGISERRVHKLCGDGRIHGVIRFGRSWGIPCDALKPEDARKAVSKQLTAIITHKDDAADFLGPDAKLLAQSGSCTVFQLENDTGNGIVTFYDVFPGAQLCYNDLHLSRITGHDDMKAAPGAEILVINHCREGRFECELSGGECGYLGDGDMAVSQMPPPMKNSQYPLAHYHGISIMLDVPAATDSIGHALQSIGAMTLDIKEIKERLLFKRPFLIMRSSEEISHIFSELYHAPDALKESYIRLKLIELLLFLSVAVPDEESSRRYFYKTRVNTIKAMREYMTAHLDKQFTLEELSARWDIPLTAMKNCFKSVFGEPIHTYMREYRMQTASALLRDADESIAEIGAKVGYDSHAQFSMAFKKAFGIPPSEYRKVVVQNQKSASDFDNR